MQAKTSQGRCAVLVKSETWLIWRQCDEAQPMCESKSARNCLHHSVLTRWSQDAEKVGASAFTQTKNLARSQSAVGQNRKNPPRTEYPRQRTTREKDPSSYQSFMTTMKILKMRWTAVMRESHSICATHPLPWNRASHHLRRLLQLSPLQLSRQRQDSLFLGEAAHRLQRLPHLGRVRLKRPEMYSST